MRPLRIAAILVPLLFIGALPAAHAHCPLCTGAVGAAAVSARYFGMDTSIIGVLIGGFAVSTGLWAGKWLKKRYVPHQTPLIVAASFALTVLPLMGILGDEMYLPVFLTGAAGSALNKVYWVDKLLLGSAIGGIATLLAFWAHEAVKRWKGTVLFPFQGVVLTLAALLATSGALYLVMR